MAKTFYKYKDREVADEINWQAVGADITKDLDAESTRRTNLKAELDKAARDAQKIVENPTLGENKGFNETALRLGDEASKLILGYNRKLKGGVIKHNEYSILVQNTTDSTNQFFDITEKLNDKYASTQKRINDGTASALEVNAMDRLRNLTRLDQTEYVFNKETGKMSAVGMVKGKDGVMIPNPDPNASRNIKAILAEMGQEFNNFDIAGTVNKDVKLLATKYNYIVGEGGVQMRDDLRANPDFQSALTNMVSAHTENQTSAATILTQSGGYTTNDISYNIADKGKEGIIFMERDSASGGAKAILTDAQVEKAKEILKKQYLSQLKMSETAMPKRTRTPRSASGTKAIADGNFLVDIAPLFNSNDPGAWEIAKNALMGHLNRDMDPGEMYSSIVRTDNGLKLYFNGDRKYKEYVFKEGWTTTDFLVSIASSLGIDDSSIAKKAGKRVSGKKGINENSWRGVGVATVAKVKKVKEVKEEETGTSTKVKLNGKKD